MAMDCPSLTPLAETGCCERDQVERLVREAVDRFGRIDCALNNAGALEVGVFKPTAAFSEEEVPDPQDVRTFERSKLRRERDPSLERLYEEHAQPLRASRRSTTRGCP